jgi:hypothetical protein
MMRTENEVRLRLRSAMADKGQDRPPFATYEAGFCDALRWVLTASTSERSAKEIEDVLRAAVNGAHNGNRART